MNVHWIAGIFGLKFKLGIVQRSLFFLWIFSIEGGGRTRRSLRQPAPKAETITIPSPRTYREKLFGNLKGIVDSEESEDETKEKAEKQTKRKAISIDEDDDEDVKIISDDVNKTESKTKSIIRKKRKKDDDDSESSETEENTAKKPRRRLLVDEDDSENSS